MSIADQSDVEALLQRPLSATEVTYLPALLDRADALIRTELPWHRFTGILTGATTSMPGSGGAEIWLPGRPVLAVTSVTLDGNVLDAGEYDWSALGDVYRTRSPHIWPRTSTIAVVWNYGLPSPPDDVVGVAADIVRAAITNPTGIRQESVGQYSVTMTNAEGTPGVSLTDEHRRLLRAGRTYPVQI